MSYKSSLTVLFEIPFWIGLYERFDDDKYEVCKITFGAEPKDYEVYDFLLKNWHMLKLIPPVKTERVMEHKINPKRMQREINSQLENKGIGTKAQQALKLQHEQNKIERKTQSREQKEARKSGNMRCGRKRKKQNIGEDKADNSRMNLPKCSLDFTLRGMCKIGMQKGDESNYVIHRRIFKYMQGIHENTSLLCRNWAIAPK